MSDERDGTGNHPASHEAVWEAMDRFSEALRDLDNEVRALARLFEQSPERTGADGDVVDRFRQSFD